MCVCVCVCVCVCACSILSKLCGGSITVRHILHCMYYWDALFQYHYRQTGCSGALCTSEKKTKKNHTVSACLSLLRMHKIHAHWKWQKMTTNRRCCRLLSLVFFFFFSICASQLSRWPTQNLAAAPHCQGCGGAKIINGMISHFMAQFSNLTLST